MCTSVFFFALKKYILKSVNNILPVKKKARFHFTLKYIFKGNATHVSIFTRSCCKLNNKIINNTKFVRSNGHMNHFYKKYFLNSRTEK